MTQPSESEHRRMVALWRVAYGSSSELGEKANAFAALRRIQIDLALSDVELAYICESTINMDDAPAEQPPDLLRQILQLFDELNIIFSALERAIVVALWALHTHVFDRFLHTPRLLVQSPEWGCGKTVLFMCLEQLTNNGFYTDDASAAVIYHQLRNQPVTSFLFDEIDNSSLWSTTDPLLRKVCNAGHRQGGNVRRVIYVNRRPEIVRLPCFGPLAMAGIEKYRFPAPLQSRALVVNMEKQPEGRDELWPGDSRCAKICVSASEWAATFRPLHNVRIPFSGRIGDNWRAPITVAETLGYGETGRATALALHQPTDDPVVRVFGDSRQIFERRGIDRIWTDPEFLPALHELENAGWDEFWGLDGDLDPHKLTRSELYRMLRTKGVRSRTVWKRIGGERVSDKGFLREQFEPVWRQLFPGTAAQSSKIIALPRHRKRRSGGTGGGGAGTEGDTVNDIGIDIGDGAEGES